MLKNDDVTKCDKCEDGYFLTKDLQCQSNEENLFPTLFKAIFFSIAGFIGLVLFLIQIIRNGKKSDDDYERDFLFNE